MRNLAYALKEFLRSQPRPILIYQMSKVGSTSVFRSLRDAGLNPLQVHFITREHLTQLRERYEVYPIQYYLGWILHFYLKRTSHRLKVITLVRDPVARYVSALYQEPHIHSKLASSIDETVRLIKSEIETPGVIEHKWKWFDRELGAVLDVNILANPFNRKEGYSICCAPRADILVLKMERLSELLPTVVSDFVGVSLKEVEANVRREERRGKEYVHVKSMLQLAKSTRERIYGSRWTQYFYTEMEIEEFTRRWS